MITIHSHDSAHNQAQMHGDDHGHNDVEIHDDVEVYRRIDERKHVHDHDGGIRLETFSKKLIMIFIASDRAEFEKYNDVEIMRIALVGRMEMIVEVGGILVRYQERDNSPRLMSRV